MKNSRFLPLLVFALVLFSRDVGAQAPALAPAEPAQHLPQAVPAVPPPNPMEARLKRELHLTKVEAAAQQARADELALAKQTSDMQVAEHLKVVEKLTADNAALAKELGNARSLQPAYDKQNETIKRSLDSFKQMVFGLIVVMLVLGVICIFALIAALSSRRGLVRAMAEAFEEEQLAKKQEEINALRKQLGESSENISRLETTGRQRRQEVARLEGQDKDARRRIRELEDEVAAKNALLTNARETLVLAGVEVGDNFLPAIPPVSTPDDAAGSQPQTVAAPQEEAATAPQPTSADLLIQAGGDPNRGTVQAMPVVDDDTDESGSSAGADEQQP